MQDKNGSSLSSDSYKLTFGSNSLGAFSLCWQKGQFDDIEGPKYRMLDDDDENESN